MTQDPGEAVTARNGDRLYRTPDGDFPSVTTVLKHGYPKEWLHAWRRRVGDAEANRIAQEARVKGDALHQGLEKWFDDAGGGPGVDFGGMPGGYGGPAATATRAMLQVLTAHVDGVWEQETMLWSATHRYAGRADMIGLWDEVPSIIDFKTAKRAPWHEPRDYFLQAAAYAYAYNEMHGAGVDQCVIVMVTWENCAVLDPWVFDARTWFEGPAPPSTDPRDPCDYCFLDCLENHRMRDPRGAPYFPDSFPETPPELDELAF